MHTTAMANNDVTIFGRLVGSSDAALTRSAARYLLALDFRPQDRQRMHELARKAQEGTLTPEEEIEIDSYERVGHLLSIWKSKARRALRKRGNGNSR